MICPKCNKEIEDGSKVCEFCGAELENDADVQNTPETVAEDAIDTEVAKGIEDAETETVKGPDAFVSDAADEAAEDEGVEEVSDIEEVSDEVYGEEYLTEKKSKKGVFIGVGIAVCAVIAAVIIALTSFGGSPTKPVQNMINGLNTANSTIFFKGYPAEYQTILKHNRVIAIQFKDQVEQQREEFQDTFGDNASIVYNVTNQTKVSEDELATYETDLSDMFSSMEEMYGENFGDTKVSDGYVLSLDLSVKDTDKDASESIDVTVLKVNGTWSVSLDDIGTLASVFYDYDFEESDDAAPADAVSDDAASDDAASDDAASDSAAPAEGE